MNISKHSGYTLVELMVTVGIIGTLAAIAVPSYNGYIELANNATARENAEQLAMFLDNYFYENGSFIAGTYDPGGDVTTLPNNLGWRPDGDNDLFKYNISLWRWRYQRMLHHYGNLLAGTNNTAICYQRPSAVAIEDH